MAPPTLSKKSTMAKKASPPKKASATTFKYNMSKQQIKQKRFNELMKERNDLQERINTEANMANFHSKCTDHQTIILDGNPQELVDEMKTQLAAVNANIKSLKKTFRPKGLLRAFGKRPPPINQGDFFQSPGAGNFF